MYIIKAYYICIYYAYIHVYICIYIYTMPKLDSFPTSTVRLFQPCTHYYLCITNLVVPYCACVHTAAIGHACMMLVANLAQCFPQRGIYLISARFTHASACPEINATGK